MGSAHVLHVEMAGLCGEGGGGGGVGASSGECVAGRKLGRERNVQA